MSQSDKLLPPQKMINSRLVPFMFPKRKLFFFSDSISLRLMLAACKGHLNDLKIYSAVDEICTDQAGLHGALETNQEREKAKTYF